MAQPPHRGRALFSGVVLLQTALLLASLVMAPASGPRPRSVCSGVAAGWPAVRRGERGAVAGTRRRAIAGTCRRAVDGARTRAGRRARARAVGNARGDARGKRRSPTGQPVVAVAERRSIACDLARDISLVLLSRRPPTRPTARRRLRRQARPPRNRVTVVAAADIDGNGKLDDLVTIESPPGTILRNVHAVPIPTDPAPPTGIFFPAGLFDYEVVVAKPGDPATVTFHLPDGTVTKDSDTGFWVLQNGRWSDLTARADADHVTDEVTVNLVDGGAGDQDRHADGVIQDPGGPGVPGDDWSLTLRLQAPADPTATFNFFLEECTETSGTTPCTPQAPRQWVDWVAVDGPTLPGTAITPVTLSDGESFTWANLDADRHYRMIEVGTDSPPDTGTGTAPVGWAVTGFACESVGATLLESERQLLRRVPQHHRPGVGARSRSVRLHRRQQPDRRSSRGQHHHGPQGGRPLGHPHEPGRSRVPRWASGATSMATATSSPEAPTGRPS